MSEKLTIKERIAITSRGYGILRKYCPGLAEGRALSTLVTTLLPFVTIWFSARIINEISDNCRINYIIFYVVAAIVINFLGALVKSILEKINHEKETQMWSFFGKIFADKQMSMDYVDIENASIQQQKSDAHENLFMFGNGLGQLVWGIVLIVESMVNILVSLAMTITLFTSRADKDIINSPIWILLLLIGVILAGVCNCKAIVKENVVFEKWCNDSVWFNRVFKFFGWDLYSTLDRAKDLRIYEQYHIAERMVHKEKEEGVALFQMSIYQGIGALIVGLMNGLCYLFVVLKAHYGAFGVGSIVQYVGALGRLSLGIQSLMYTLPDNMVYCSHLKKLYEFLDIPNLKYQGSLPIEKRAFCQEGDYDYELEFSNVSFKYPGSDQYALRNVNLKIPLGKTLAVVGKNGSGKTTFIKLLCRLYDPTEGSILLNGIDIRKYDYDEYKMIFSVVFQDFKLFSFTLGQNVAASVDYDKTMVESCLQKAGFRERLLDMKEGVDTYLYKYFDEAGVEISGGEAQKIALARALYKDAPFIILDEPTAALDPIAEYEVYSKFNEIIGEKTAIYISHRLSSCKFCDDIVVFDQGKIIQKGSHSQLIVDETGSYYELWNAQAQYYES